MSNDNRKKGCPNLECERNKNKIKLKSTENYCPKCGTALIYVCSKCFTEIEDIDFKHKLCLRCEEIERDKKEKIKQNAQKAGKAVVATVGVVAVGIKNGATKELAKKGAEIGAKIIK